MSSLEYEDLFIVPPLLNTAALLRTTVIPVTGTSTRFDLRTRLTNAQAGHLIEMTADGCDVYYAFNDSDAGTVDETVETSGVTACAVLFNGMNLVRRILGNHVWLIVKGSTTGRLRINIASLASGQSAKDV
jgi:hypothetical protein